MADPLLDLPAVRLRLAALDRLELGVGLIELLARPLGVDLPRVDGVVDEGERAVLLDLEEARAGRELADLLVTADAHARAARLQRCHERSAGRGCRSRRPDPGR